MICLSNCQFELHDTICRTVINHFYLSIYLVPWVLHPLVSDAQSAFNFSLNLFTVVLSAPHHQPSLLVRAWDRHKYHYLVFVVGFLGCS